MSDNSVISIPADPHYVPDASRRIRARDRFAEIAPDAGEIEIQVSDKVVFFDCGGNFERIRCPSCGAELPTDWWQEQMSADYVDGGFKLAAYATPCCRSPSTLNELINEWPQGFARFALVADNPRIERLEDKDKAELEEILGTTLRVIYRRL